MTGRRHHDDHATGTPPPDGPDIPQAFPTRTDPPTTPTPAAPPPPVDRAGIPPVPPGPQPQVQPYVAPQVQPELPPDLQLVSQSGAVAPPPEGADPGRAPLTITIPRFWSRPHPRTTGHRSTPSRARRTLSLPGRPVHRAGVGAAALAVVAAVVVTMTGNPLTRTELDAHSSTPGPVGSAPALGAAAPADPGAVPLTLVTDPLDPNAALNAGAPTVSIPGGPAPADPAAGAVPTSDPGAQPGNQPAVQPGQPGVQPVAQAVALPAAAPPAPLPAAPRVGQNGAPKKLSSSGIPARAKTAYLNAATRMKTLAPTCRLPWTLLAAIGRVESNHARVNGSTLIASTGRAHPAIYGIRLNGAIPGTATIRDTDRGALDGDPGYDRAVGPMQFLPATWRTFAIDADRDGAANPQDLDDAALAAGRYLCTGATTTNHLSTRTGQWNAAYRYNRSINYANLVLALATTYATGKPTTVVNPPGGATTTVPTVTITITPPTATTTLTPPTTATSPTTSTTSAATVTATTTSTSTGTIASTTTLTPTTAPPTGPTLTVTVTVITVTVTGQPSSSTTTSSATTPPP